MMTAGQAAPIERLRPATFNRSQSLAFVLWDDPSNQGTDWQEAANKINQVTLISYFSPEPSEAQLDAAWASLAEEAIKSWLKDNPF